MAKFVPRTTAPSTTDKNWLHTSKGGYNKCILISGSSCLPNCTGYVWGRWRELLGKDHNLSVNQAEVWYSKNDGYSRGNPPKVGAVICWAKGSAKTTSDGSGHVAVVEEVYADGSILISQSGYNSKRFWTQKLSKPYKYGSAYTFQGFIYLPITYDEDSTNVTTKTTYTGTFPTLPSRGYFKKGDTGTQVKNVQRFLNWAISSGLSVDGSYGSLTVQAVKNFQKKVGITVDGSYGKNTQSKAKAFEK